jgi:hypothetical protein
MTWAEFKAAVEAAGVKDEDVIFCIDVDGWYKRAIDIERGKDGTVWIKHKGDA